MGFGATLSKDHQSHSTHPSYHQGSTPLIFICRSRTQQHFSEFISHNHSLSFLSLSLFSLPLSLSANIIHPPSFCLSFSISLTHSLFLSTSHRHSLTFPVSIYITLTLRSTHLNTNTHTHIVQYHSPCSHTHILHHTPAHTLTHQRNNFNLFCSIRKSLVQH